MTPSQFQTLVIRASRPFKWIVSQIMNVAWCVWHINRCIGIEGSIWAIEDIVKEKKIDGVKLIMSRIEWRADKIFDWYPWLKTIVANEYRDDCDGAAVLGKWLLEQAGYEACIFHLCREWKTWHDVFSYIRESVLLTLHAFHLHKAIDEYWTVGHAVAVGFMYEEDADGVIPSQIVMISNNSTVIIDSLEWRKAVLDWSWHKDRYDKVV